MSKTPIVFVHGARLLLTPGSNAPWMRARFFHVRALVVSETGGAAPSITSICLNF
jgi:hypothetical protein